MIAVFESYALLLGYIVMLAAGLIAVSAAIWVAGELVWRRAQALYGLAFIINAARHVQREIDAAGEPLCGGGHEHDRWVNRWPRPWPCPKCAALWEKRRQECE